MAPDVVAPPLHVGTHQHLQQFPSGVGVGQRDAPQRAGGRIQSAVRQLVGVHLTEPLEALPADALGAAAPALGQTCGDGIAFGLAEGPVGLLADPRGVQRWLGGEHPPIGEHRPHVGVDQRQQQAADVAPVHIGVAEDHDAPVAGGGDVEVGSHAGAHRSEQRLRLGVVEHLAQRRLGGVHQLAPQRKDGDVLGVAPRFGGTGRRLTLHDDQLAVGSMRPAVGELVGKARRAQRRCLAPVGLQAPRRCPGLHGVGDLGPQRGDVAARPVGREPLRQRRLDGVVDDGLHCRGAQFLLGLATELRLRHDDLQRADQPLLDLLPAGPLPGTGEALRAVEQHVVDRPRQRPLEAGQVRPAGGGRDRVHEAAHVAAVPVGPLQRGGDRTLPHNGGELAVHRHLLLEAAPAGDIDDPGDRTAAGAGQLGHQSPEPLLGAEVERFALRPAAAVADGDSQGGHQVARQPRPLAGGGVVEGGPLVEQFPVGPEAHLRERLPRGLDLLQLVRRGEPVGVAPPGLPLGEVQAPQVAVATHLHAHPLRQGVHHRGPHPVQPAAGAIGGPAGAGAELAAGVQLAEHHLDGRDVPPGGMSDRDAPAVVAHRHRAVAAEGHVDPPGVSGRRLVDAVVDQLPHQVHQPGRAGSADVHAGALADRLESLQGLDRIGLVVPRSVRCGALRRAQAGLRSAGLRRRLRRGPVTRRIEQTQVRLAGHRRHHRLWPTARIGLGPERATNPRRVGGKGNGTGSLSGVLGRAPVTTNTSTSGPT